MARLSGKTVVVTGAGTGIGEGTAQLVAAEGADVLLADINEAAASSVTDDLRQQGSNAEACHLDLADEGSIRAMIATALETFGRLDALVNNAAKTTLTAEDFGVENTDLRVWDETMHVNLRGTMLACKHALPALRASGGGAIVNIASGAALRGARGLTAYGVSKAGIITLGEYIAAQHGEEGIRCNTISPGIIITPKTYDAFGTPAQRNKVMPLMLSPRLGVPADIGAAIVWLISDEGAYVNGHCISIDGGQMSHQNYLMDALSGD
jgi:NAD(P)-dependent dehydrogenase (short-subunit alcohol dehydrogenase family)